MVIIYRCEVGTWLRVVLRSFVSARVSTEISSSVVDLVRAFVTVLA